MSRTADPVGEVTEKLRVYWVTLVRYKETLSDGDDKKFYELVQRCVEQLFEWGVECTWETKWRDVGGWKKVQLKPAEAERRIREHVRPWLQEARKLKFARWWGQRGT
jgi:hypothetical protein